MIPELPPNAAPPASAVGVLSLAALGEAIANGEVWQRNAHRTELIQASFGAHAKIVGVPTAIRDAFGLFEVPALPTMLREVEFEIAAISCLNVEGASDGDLARLLSECPPWTNRPLLRAFALFSDPKRAPDVYRHLRHLLDLSERKTERDLGTLIFVLAVEAAQICDEADLISLTKLVPSTPDSEEIIAMIAAAGGARNSQIAVEFVVQQSNRNPLKLARYVRALHPSSDQLAAICAQLSAAERSEFVTRYCSQLDRANPQLYVELAQAIDPKELPLDVRSQLIGGLLKAGAGDALNWLETLPEGEKAAALSSAFGFMSKQPGWSNMTSKAWLAAATMCKGIDEKQLVAAIRSASSFLDWNTLRSYTSKLSNAARSGIERDLYSAQVSQLANTDRRMVQSFVESAPKEFQSQLLWTAASAIANRAPECIMDWYRETSDPDTKRTLEEAMLTTPNLTSVPAEKRKEWILERVNKPEYLKHASLAVNRYVLDLMTSDTSAALKFATTLPDSPARDAALGELAREWAHRDPASASEWIVELPAGKGRDAALTELTKASRDEPESAFINLAAISDPKMRSQAATAVVEWWKRRDAQKIVNLVQQSTLSSEEKSRLLQLLEK
ncbi:hypothetical protein ACXR0O_25665 [Verrucomicrobiota bacterium sgz303538]